MSRRRTPADYQELAASRGLRWLGPEAPDTKTKTAWKCEKGHQWEAVYGSIKRGSSCPVCAIARRAEKRRRKPADYHALAMARGFRWIGPEVSNANTKTTWECKQGHRWESRYGSIQQGQGCPICAGNAPKLPNDYHALAIERGFHWLGPEVSSVHARTVWECQQGHQWQAPYGSIRQGSGCPLCAGIARKTPEDYYVIANKRRIRWRGPKVSNSKTKTAWECRKGHRWEASYHDIQQGRGCPACATEIAADKRRHKPTDYQALAKKLGFRWLGPEVSNAHAKTGWECKQGHQWEANYNNIQQGYGCPTCGGNLPKIPADYRGLAEERGFSWLGPKVSDTKTKTNWKCRQGHQWEARYNDISKGVGCPICAAERTALQQKNKPSEYHALAKKRGFQWLGPEVPNSKTKTEWKCAQGHRWEARYNDLIKGSGCPICIDMINGALVSQVQRDLSEILGGELNHPFGKYSIDIALNISGVAIAVEYDSWFWHGDRQEYDAMRDEELVAGGWRILRVKSNSLLPTREQTDTALARLVAGETRVEIVLDDWGIGPTRFENG